MENKDSFGLTASAYRDFRPRYPAALFEFLASVCAATEAALDCATGNGQAAVDLARRFDRVAAFDSSRAQLDAAIADPKVEYRVGTAEAIPFAEREFDLVTVAQAAHWFDLPRFYRELERVVKPNAVVAIWGYSYCLIEPEIDSIVASELLAPIEPYWAEGRRVIIEKYASIPFPFDEIDWPEFVAAHEWSRGAYLNYLRTWSAYKRFVATAGFDPLPGLEAAIGALWPERESKIVRFELAGRVGRLPRR